MAVEQSTNSYVAVVGEDVDLTILLIVSTPPTQDILLLKPGRGKTKPMLLSTQEMQHLEFEYILFLHAFTGCDTTFATSRRSKVDFTKLYLRTEAIKQAAVVFYNSTSTHKGV